MRGLKQKNVWVMEQGSGAGGWGSYPATPQPGQMRLWAYQAVARGADMISFFRWRSCRWGREQYWHGILYHHGIPQRRYDEAKQLGAEFKALSAELDGSEVRAEVGILYDYDSLWALETQPNTGDGFDYRERPSGGMPRSPAWASWPMRSASTPISRATKCSSRNRPRLPAHDGRAAGSVRSRRRHADPWPRSGVKEEEGAIVDTLLPGLLRKVAGCHVEEYDAFSQVAGLELRVRCPADHLYRAHGLADVLVRRGTPRLPPLEVTTTRASRRSCATKMAGPLLLRGDDHRAGRTARLPGSRCPAQGRVATLPICRSASR